MDTSLTHTTLVELPGHILSVIYSHLRKGKCPDAWVENDAKSK